MEVHPNDQEELLDFAQSRMEDYFYIVVDFFLNQYRI